MLATLGKPEPATKPAETASVGSRPKALAWLPPLTREDGSTLALSQIAGYRIYFRLRHQQSFRMIALDDASTTRYPLTDMAPGAYEFAITTIDQDGRESRRSDPVEVNLI